MRHASLLKSLLPTLITLLVFAPTLVRAAPSLGPLRGRVLAHLTESRQASQASSFQKFAARERQGFQDLARPQPPSRADTFGPNTVPDTYVVYYGRSDQPDTQFDKTDARLKREIRSKAAKLRLNDALTAWEKIERLQAVINMKVQHAGNEVTFEKNPNPYTRYNQQVKASGRMAKLSDYLRLGLVVCREKAFLTQVALEDAGFEARLVRGDVLHQGARVGSHVWNEVKLDGQWTIVDTTNPKNNKLTPEQVEIQGTGRGYTWSRDEMFVIGPPPEKRKNMGYHPYWMDLDAPE
jgi:hypothetical protein